MDVLSSPESRNDREQNRPTDVASRASVESLESRRLLTIDAVAPLPFVDDFSSVVPDSYFDKDAQGTGLTYDQPNTFNTHFQPLLMDLDTNAGVLKVTTQGSATSGSNFNDTNSLVNALGTRFDARTAPFAITARLLGPLSNIDKPYEQAGVMFGCDQDNYVKLVAAYTTDSRGNPVGQRLQFTDEQTVFGQKVHTVAVDLNIGNFATFNTLDLRISGDPTTGKVYASYSVNGSSFVTLTQTIQIHPTLQAPFFAANTGASIIAMHKNNIGPETFTYDSFSVVNADPPQVQSPTVVGVRPGVGATGVSRDVFVATDLHMPNVGHGVETSTLNKNTVRLFRTSDGAQIQARLNTSGGGDTLTLQPLELLDANTQYTFQVTNALKDTSGAPFAPFSSTFTTGTSGGTTDSSIAFEQVGLTTAQGNSFTSLAMGPDGKLYASTYDGKLMRWNINADGTLGAASTYNIINNTAGSQRTITGIAFAPGGTASLAQLYVSHSILSDDTATAPDWSGKLSRVNVTPDGMNTYDDVVVNLPRSIRDHMNNQIAFGPDGALYLAQGSNTSYGDADAVWGMRPEHLLNAAILRIDLSKITAPVDVKTEDGGTYNPFAANAPVTLYATGLRNAFDLVFANNGKLYAPTNGSAAGGNTPGYPSTRYVGQRIDGTYTGGNVPAISNVGMTENDYIFQVVKGGYYGHPNPTRGEFVLNGGNPTSGADPFQVGQYPVGTKPDTNYRGNTAKYGSNYVYALGQNYSPDGIIQYHGNAFGGKLNNKLLVARYAGGDDIAVLTLNSSGGVQSVTSGIAGLGRLSDPLDLVQGNNGAIYVTELAGQRITLLRPISAGGKIETDKSKMVFNDPRGGANGPAQTLTIRNVGTTALGLPSDAFTITGADATQFVISTKPTVPGSIAAGASVDVTIRFNPPSGTSISIKTATLVIKSNDPTTPSLSVSLRGLPTTGTGDQNEPSLQRILDLWQIPTNVGDNDPSTTVYPTPNVKPNDEVEMPRLLKADATKPVTVEVLGVMGVSTNPAVRFGYHGAGSPVDRTEVFSVAQADAQSVQPFINGRTSFDPGNSEFGLYTIWPAFTDNGQPRVSDSEDIYNTWEPNNNNRKKARFFKLRDASGNVVPDAYVLAWEEYAPAYDSNDLVMIIRNVKGPASLQSPEIGIENLDGAPFNDRLIFNQVVIKNPTFPDEPHTDVQLKINNSGAAPLNISSITFNGPWALKAPAPTSIAPGGSSIVTVTFTATGGSFYNGSMTINSNDTNEAAKTVELSGFWQPQTENFKEPDLATLVKVFGYKTVITNSGQVLNRGGLVEAVGDEILSPYWNKAVGSMPVTVRQLDAFHSQGTPAKLRYYAKGSSSTTDLIISAPNDSQSILPNPQGSSTAPAYASFNPTGTFGWKVDTEFSDDTKNVQEHPGGNYGHHVRFFVAKDRNGNVIPNTYLLTVDYSGINYDYQDNVYVITNIKPELAPARPALVSATSFSSGTEIRWAANSESGIVGYNVYRSATPDGTYTKLNTDPYSGLKWLDNSSATAGAMYYYKVTAVNSSGRESDFAVTNAIRETAGSGSGTTPPPATPGDNFANSIDIGNPTPAGSSSVGTVNEDYDIAGGGAGGIANPSDQFRFVSRVWAGDFDMKVNVSSLSNTSPFAVAGLMARETTAAGSRFVMVGVNPSQTIMDWRADTNAGTLRVATGAYYGSNTWIRLRRAGTLFEAYISNNGTTWTKIGEATPAIGTDVQLGMAVTSKNGGSTALAQFRDLSLTSVI